MSDFNTLLNRPISSGIEYNNLIPKSFCKKIKGGFGDTDYSVNQMAGVIVDYSYQAENLAPVLKGNSLEQTCKKIKDFLYNNFQYKADENEQYIRSLACSWYDRKNGIDCKSYSIAAGIILAELGITFFIRKIKQPNYAPDQWTHVYIIVPKDQNNLNLQKGYYTIDGTLKEDTECLFIEKQDKIMSLQHSVLNGGINGGLDADNDGQIKFNDAVVLAEKFGKDIANFFKSLKCLGKQAYDDGKFDKNMLVFTKFYIDNINAINKSLVDKDFVTFSNEVLNYFGDTSMLSKASVSKRGENWKNDCTKKRLDVQIQLAKYYENVVGGALKEWLNKYFDAVQTNEKVEYTSSTFKKDYGFDFITETEKGIFTKINYTPKNLNIPAFELTKYIQDFKNKPIAEFNAVKAIEDLSTILFKETTPVNNNSDVKPYVAGSSQAGFGVFGWVVVLAGLGFAFTKMKDNPKTSAAPKKRVYKSKSK